jgi:hypothetical protein
MITGDHNLSTAVLGSYTAEYKILRANSAGIQAKITIKNSMSPSSFAHIATGYGTPDNDGLVALGGAMRAHDMTITFRTAIPN